MMEDYDPSHLLCYNSRMVSARGVHVCPILVEDPRGFLGRDLEQAVCRALLHDLLFAGCEQEGQELFEPDPLSREGKARLPAPPHRIDRLQQGADLVVPVARGLDRDRVGREAVTGPATALDLDAHPAQLERAREQFQGRLVE